MFVMLGLFTTSDDATVKAFFSERSLHAETMLCTELSGDMGRTVIVLLSEERVTDDRT